MKRVQMLLRVHVLFEVILCLVLNYRTHQYQHQNKHQQLKGKERHFSGTGIIEGTISHVNRVSIATSLLTHFLKFFLKFF